MYRGSEEVTQRSLSRVSISSAASGASAYFDAPEDLPDNPGDSKTGALPSSPLSGPYLCSRPEPNCPTLHPLPCEEPFLSSTRQSGLNLAEAALPFLFFKGLSFPSLLVLLSVEPIRCSCEL